MTSEGSIRGWKKSKTDQLGHWVLSMGRVSETTGKVPLVCRGNVVHFLYTAKGKGKRTGE